MLEILGIGIRGFFRHMYVHLRIRNRDTVAVERLFHVLQQPVVQLPVVFALGPHLQLQHHSTVVVTEHHHFRFRFCQSLRSRLHLLQQYLAGSINIVLIADAEVQVYAAGILVCVVDDLAAGDYAVWDKNGLVVRSDNAGVKTVIF